MCLDLLNKSTHAESSGDNVSITDGDEGEAVETSLQSIIGHQRYSPEIRNIYHSLFTDQVPVSKIASIICVT